MDFNGLVKYWQAAARFEHPIIFFYATIIARVVYEQCKCENV